MLIRFLRALTGPRLLFALLFLAFLIPLVRASAARAQEDAEPARSGQQALNGQAAGDEQETDAPPADPLQRGTPRGTVDGFLNAARDGRWEDAAQYLDLARIPEADRAPEGPELARQLKAVLDENYWVEVDKISDEAAGDTEDDLAPQRESITSWKGKRGEVQVTLERVTSEDGALIWLFSAGLVERIPALYEELGYGPLAKLLPRVLLETRFLEVALWQWIGLVLLVVVAWLLAMVFARFIVRLIQPWTSRSRTDLDDRLLELLIGPARFLIALGLFHVGIEFLHLSVPAREIMHGTVRVLAIIGFTWAAFRVTDLFAGITRVRLEAHGRTGATALVPWGARTMKVAIGALTILAALDTFGFDVTALIAGLGVGGLAVALAAQKTLENVFGGVSVLVDQPVRPGDFCKFGDQVGTVEDIGMRSTRIRTLDRTVVAIPNAEFAAMKLENFALRDRIRLITTLGLRYETTSDQLRHVIVGLRGLLVAHPKVLPDPLRVRFVSFGAYSLDLEVFCYVDTADFNEFLAVREDIFLRMIDVVAASGTGFAFPSSTTYLARDGGIDTELGEKVAAEVDEWRKSGRMPMPDFAPEESAKIDNSLDWPPKGSALSGT